ncbi:hypothetical protein X801_09720, partial [Opisthorchis viverrini]
DPGNVNPSGWLLLGGVDHNFHVEELFYIGESKFVHDHMSAVVDTGCPWIQLSADSLAEIHEVVTPTRFKDGFHYIDCSKRSKLPVLHFILFGGQRLSLEPEYYVFKIVGFSVDASVMEVVTILDFFEKADKMQGKKISLSLKNGHNRITAMWPMLSLCLVFALCFSITQRLNSNPTDSNQSMTDNQMDLPGSSDTGKTTNYTNSDPIHLFLVIRRLNVLNKAVTMLKSLLYYQGHFQSGMKTCELDWSVPSGILCENINATPIAQPIILHLVVHQKAWNKTFGRFQQWNSTRFLVKLYEFKNELALRGTEAERSPRVQLALQNLMAPYIVDQSVEKWLVSSSPVNAKEVPIIKLGSVFIRMQLTPLSSSRLELVG